MLAVAGGVLGLMLGYVGVRALLAVSPAGLPRIGENGAAVGVDWRVLGFTLAVSCVDGNYLRALPRAQRFAPRSELCAQGEQQPVGHGIPPGQGAAVLVVTEVSLALVLLVGSALLIRTFVALRAVNPGFDAHNVLTMEMSLTGDRFEKTASVAQMVRDGRDRLNALPGVEASAVGLLPAARRRLRAAVHYRGAAAGQGAQTGGAGWLNVSPGYFETSRFRLCAGVPSPITIARARRAW